MVKILAPFLIALSLLSVADQSRFRIRSVTTPPGGGGGGDAHEFFEDKLDDADLWKAMSMRPVVGHPCLTNVTDWCDDPYYSNQLLRIGGGYDGYLNASALQHGYVVSYDYAADTNPAKQDATKFTIPAYATNFVGYDNGGAITTLDGAVGVSSAQDCSQTVTLAVGTNSQWGNPRGLIIDNEIMENCDAPGGSVEYYNTSTRVMNVKRAMLGTTAASHSSGAQVKMAVNSLETQVRLPLVTSDGNTYLFTWDIYYTDSYVGTNQQGFKSFQFTSNGLFIEPRALVYNPSSKASCWNASLHAGNLDTRAYNLTPNDNATWTLSDGNHLGPNASSPVADALSPQDNPFCFEPNTWVRIIYRFQQKATDWDILDAWACDENQACVRLHTGLQISMEPGENKLNEFWWELNTSEDGNRTPINVPLVAYGRNLLAFQASGVASAGSLSDANVTSRFLVQPVADAPPPAPGPFNVLRGLFEFAFGQ
jgi:hypothetical protein